MPTSTLITSLTLCMFYESFYFRSVAASSNESLKISEMFSTINNGVMVLRKAYHYYFTLAQYRWYC